MTEQCAFVDHSFTIINTCETNPVVSQAMVVALPKDPNERRLAIQWLGAEGIRHMSLFQSVQIDDAVDAERFKLWMREDDQSDRLKG